jgi:hypothetical protein
LWQDSGSEGQRLTEAQAINKSLSNLGNVIMALAQKVSMRLKDQILIWFFSFFPETAGIVLSITFMFFIRALKCLFSLFFAAQPLVLAVQPFLLAVLSESLCRFASLLSGFALK